jgi:prolyl oligopeptidase PreP (S9A serine peptidase family)
MAEHLSGRRSDRTGSVDDVFAVAAQLIEQKHQGPCRCRYC